MPENTLTGPPSFLPDKYMLHNQKVCNLLGNRVGRVFLIMESGWRKYGFIRGLKRLIIHFYEDLIDYIPLIICIIKKKA